MTHLFQTGSLLGVQANLTLDFREAGGPPPLHCGFRSVGWLLKGVPAPRVWGCGRCVGMWEVCGEWVAGPIHTMVVEGIALPASSGSIQLCDLCKFLNHPLSLGLPDGKIRV